MSAAATAPTFSRNSPPRKSSAAVSSSASFSERAHRYAKDVVRGKIIACVELKQACRRHLDDLKKTRRKAYPWRFDENKAHRFCRFFEGFQHYKNDYLGHAARRENFRLGDWQCFVFCSIYGWVERDTGLRRFREAYISIAKKNGKTPMGAGVLLYHTAADGEFGAEVFAAACSREQAKDGLFQAAQKMAEASLSFRTNFKVWVNAGSIVIQHKGAVCKPVKGNPQDGPSPNCVVADEYHEYKTNYIIDWARNGMVARSQPLLFEITTAGTNTASPCYDKHQEARDVLAGRRKNERLFTVIYTVDKDVDWTSKKALLMANPNHGVSVNPETLREDQFQATQSAIRQNLFKTKNLNIWMNQKVAWMNMVKWDACADPALRVEDFFGDPCIESVDLASRRDTVSTIRLFRRWQTEADGNGNWHYYCFSRHYLNEQQIKDPKNTHFLEWVKEGHLIETPGDITDYLRVNDDLAADAKQLQLQELVFDPLHAAPLVQFLRSREDWNQAVACSELKQTEENTSAPMKEFEAIVLAGRFHFDGSPILSWMVGNTICRVSMRENWYPVRENIARKIDGAVAIILALNRWMAQEGDGYTNPEVTYV